MIFKGFTNSSIQFLNDLSENNNREWFAENKKTYKEYLEVELLELFSAISDSMLMIDSRLFVQARTSKVISRIYKDMRFSKGKSPYRTNMWFTFRRNEKNWKELPAFFFEISADSYSYGLGYYEASRNSMDNLRNTIDTMPMRVLEIVKNIQRDTQFSIEGQKYKRIINPNIEPALIPLYQSKNLYLIHKAPISAKIFNGEIQFELIEQFLKTSEFYHELLCEQY